jgi:predicted AlkP superfamily phosphohydrolase/phosphomutase
MERILRTSPLIRLGAAILIVLAALGCGSQPSQKVVVLGIDGLTFDLLIPWAKEGQLPNFQKLLEEGSSTQLISSVPPSSPPAWTSAVTGVNPGKHGIFGFIKGISQVNGKQELNFYTSRDRRADPLWVILTERGRRSVVINVPNTSPPDQIRGVMISGFPHTSSTNFTSPPEYRFKIPEYRKDIYGQLISVGGEQAFWDDMNDIMDRRADVIIKLFREESWDLFFAVFTITDRVQHYFWKFMDPQHPNWEAQKADQFGDAILRTYQRVDEFLGRLWEQLDEETVLLVMSDHGFGPVYQMINGEYFVAGVELPEGFALQTADKMGAKFHIMTTKTPPYDQRTLENYARSREILTQALKALRDPKTGRRVIKAVYTREELFHGPNLSQAPDILALENDGYLFWNWHRTDDGVLFPSSDDPDFNRLFSGFHKMNGVLIMAGGNIRPGINNYDANIMDITPTVLYLLEEPIPSEMDGSILSEPIDPAYVQQHPLDARWDRPGGSTAVRSLADTSGAVNAFIEEQLRAIGYVQ